MLFLLQDSDVQTLEEDPSEDDNDSVQFMVRL